MGVDYFRGHTINSFGETRGKNYGEQKTYYYKGIINGKEFTADGMEHLGIAVDLGYEKNKLTKKEASDLNDYLEKKYWKG